VSRGATQERIGTSDEPPIEEPVSSRNTRPWTVRYGAGLVAVGLQDLLQDAVRVVEPDGTGGEELLLRAGVVWKEGLGYRTRAG
jgi:hypothetical protein